ncbi:MAG: hypothetical protein LBD49_03705 [Oscillospiraceae bacterium]|jgi:hypothetical protein|nr:hypothetical protein [Oscillospiraceae bacterium]
MMPPELPKPIAERSRGAPPESEWMETRPDANGMIIAEEPPVPDEPAGP